MSDNQSGRELPSYELVRLHVMSHEEFVTVTRQYYGLGPIKKKWQIWSEGYAVTGNESPARLMGEVEADTFEQACVKWSEASSEPYLFNQDKLTYSGCRLFDNEADARERFG